MSIVSTLSKLLNYLEICRLWDGKRRLKQIKTTYFTGVTIYFDLADEKAGFLHRKDQQFSYRRT